MRQGLAKLSLRFTWICVLEPNDAAPSPFPPLCHTPLVFSLPLAHPVSSSVLFLLSQLCSLAGLSQQLQPGESGVMCLGTILRLQVLACSFLVTIQSAFRFSKNSSVFTSYYKVYLRIFVLLSLNKLFSLVNWEGLKQPPHWLPSVKRELVSTDNKASKRDCQEHPLLSGRWAGTEISQWVVSSLWFHLQELQSLHLP